MAPAAAAAAAVVNRMISAWDTYFEVDEYYTYKKPVGHGAYGVVISALDTRDNSKVKQVTSSVAVFIKYMMSVSSAASAPPSLERMEYGESAI